MAARRSYTAAFKLNVVAYAKEMGNRAAGNLFCVNEKQIRYWKKQEDLLRVSHKSKRANRGGAARWSLLEDLLEAWVLEEVATGRIRLCTKLLQQKAKAIAREKNIQGFIGGPSWCFRFMRRKKLVFVNVKGRNRMIGNIQQSSETYNNNNNNEDLCLMLSAGNQMRKNPQNTIGPRELLLPNIEAEAQEQLHFTSNNVENLDEMKEEIQEDQADSNMSLMANENQSHEMTHEGANSVTMDTYQPSSRKLLVVPEHQYSMMSSLASMWKDQKMCDASIGNGTTIIMVHKLVLLAISPTLLSSSEVRNNCFLRVNFPANISENAMRAFAEYMYNGMLDLDPLTLTQLQQISYQLGIDELGMLCEMHLCSQTHISNSIDNIMCPGTSLSHLVQSDSSSLQMLEQKLNSVPEVKKKRTLPTNTWLQCSGSREIVSHSPVAVKTEPQNSVQNYCLTNPTEQALHPARSTTTAWPVSEATYCQRSNSTFSMTKASKTTKTFQEYNRTIESQFVSHIKMEPADNLESEYGQHHPTLSSNSSTSNLPFTKINQSRDISESTKLTPGASPLISTFSNFQQKYARSKTNATAAALPLPATPAGKVVPLTCDESARVNLTGKNHFDATVNSEQPTSDTPYPVMLFSSEMKNLPLNISQTTKSKQYVDLTSS